TAALRIAYMHQGDHAVSPYLFPTMALVTSELASALIRNAATVPGSPKMAVSASVTSNSVDPLMVVRWRNVLESILDFKNRNLILPSVPSAMPIVSTCDMTIASEYSAPARMGRRCG